MKNIYKREPLVRSLPTGYAEMDAINYKNLSGFKGLQIYDNPLVADPNSTYSCKNVYVDEHGNLTVRPALTAVEKLSSTLLWRHEFTDGTIITVVHSDGYLLQLSDGTTSAEGIYFVSEPTVIPVESNNKKYLFVNNSNNILYEVSELALIPVEGVKLLDDPLNTDIEHYNILNNKVIQEYVKAITDAERPDSLYIPISQLPSPIVYSDTTKIHFENDCCVVCSDGKIVIFTKTGVIDLDVDTWNQKSSSDWCVSIGDTLNVTVLGYSEIPDELPEVNSIQQVKHFEINLDTGEIINTYTVSCGHENTILFSGYGWVGALVHSEQDFNSYVFYTKEITDDITLDDTTESGSYKYPDMSGWVLPTDTNGNAVKQTYSIFDNGRIIEWFYFTKHCIVGAFFNEQSSTDKYLSSVDFKLTSYIQKTLNKRIEVYSPQNYDPEAFSFSDMAFKTYAGDVSYCVFLPFTAASKWLLFTTNGRQVNRINDELLPESADNIVALTQAGIYIKANTNAIRRLAYDGSAISYIFDDPVYFANDDFVIYSDMAVWRKPALARKEVERPVEVIPVLSQISEEPITGFFLDNYWWFVTEHSVFGTGMDGNGLSTVERFDPLKYFKFSEKITGAIRLSDTSFWVFHNDGAYLIYKTSMTVLNRTEYRWLCTATAKSKGCDFENALVTLPVSSYVATVTNSDICTVQMKENIQSDERSLIPITMSFASDIRQLLSETESIKIVNYKYLTIFILNKIDEDGHTPAVVLDNVTNSWWYWEFPVRYVSQAWQTETDTYLLCPHENIIVALNSEEYSYTIGSIVYAVYADRLDTNQSPTQIDWGWQSAMQVFGTVERRKQLLFTTFVFDDFMPTDSSEQTIELGYYFNIYSKNYATSKPDATTATIFRASNTANKTIISNFNYLQLVLCNMPFDGVNFETLTKPKICCISLKYRLLRGEWT